MVGPALMPIFAPPILRSALRVGYVFSASYDSEDDLVFTYSNAPQTLSRRLFAVIASYRDNDDEGTLTALSFRTAGGSSIAATVLGSAGSSFGDNSVTICMATAIVPTNDYNIVRPTLGGDRIQVAVIAAYGLTESTYENFHLDSTSTDGSSFSIDVTNPEGATVITAFSAFNPVTSISIDRGTQVHNEGDAFLGLGVTADAKVEAQISQSYVATFNGISTVRGIAYVSWL